QENEQSWNESEPEFLAPRLVRNGSRSVLCFYDRLAHRLPAPHAYFPRQMALRYCTHALYHAPFALDEGRLVYRNPGFDRKFGLAELRRVANRRGYGTKLLFTVGGEEADNANWSRLAVDREQRAQLARDIKAALSSLGYDGVNLHWTTPGGRCGRPQDVSALTGTHEIKHYIEVGTIFGVTVRLSRHIFKSVSIVTFYPDTFLRDAAEHCTIFLFQGPSVRSLMDSLGARLFHGHWDKLCITQSLAA
ncbi:unnamed protein product, partial [Ixodes hexagonus]